MTLFTLPRYLLGSRQAILEVAHSRWSVPIGLLFVLSAGFAREYDGQDLLAEPWHIVRPLGASLISSTLLVLLLWPGKKWYREHSAPNFDAFWRAIVGLFWMTAPMAWLYAVPYERFLSPVDAVAANLWTLAVVAVWRLVLMTRAVSVLLAAGPVSVFFVVMLFSDLVLVAGLAFAPKPILDTMGGLRLSDDAALRNDVTLNAWFWSVLTAPIWLIGGIVAMRKMKQRWVVPSPAQTRAGRAPRALLALAIASVLCWASVLPFTQPEQRLRHKVESLWRSGGLAPAYAEIARHEQGDFPPGWSPPPRRYPRFGPFMFPFAEVRSALQAHPLPPWAAADVREAFSAELMSVLQVPEWESWARYAEEVDPEWLTQNRLRVGDLLFILEHDPTLSEADKEGLRFMINRLPAPSEPQGK